MDSTLLVKARARGSVNRVELDWVDKMENYPFTHLFGSPYDPTLCIPMIDMIKQKRKGKGG